MTMKLHDMSLLRNASYIGGAWQEGGAGSLTVINPATGESIAEIVYLTGFSEPSTFYRAFKRWEGMTPIEYRQLNNINVQRY